jgi:hypothetical protein
MRLKVSHLRGFESGVETPEMWCGQEYIAKIYVFSFALILFEIVTDLPGLGRTGASEGLGKLPVNASERFEIS